MNTKNNPTPVLKHVTFSKDLSVYAKSVVNHFEGNSKLLDTNPTIPTVLGHIAELDKAEVEAKSGAHGAVQDRNLKRLRVKQDLNHWRDFVQSVVETATSFAEAVSIIESAGMFVKKVRGRVKPALAAKQGDVSGEVAVAAKAVRNAVSYYWQYSLNQVDWVSVPEMTQTSTTIGGLTPGRIYYFRFRTLKPSGLTDFSQVVSLMVQ
jgi:hypothetical protein